MAALSVLTTTWVGFILFLDIDLQQFDASYECNFSFNNTIDQFIVVLYM